jgi:hypothetical protein
MRLIALAPVTFLLALWVGAGQAMAQDYRLIMIEAPHCVYCRAFNRDIAPIYARAPEGRAVPLEHVQLRGPFPDGVTFASRPAMTPTFILIGPDGAEVDRLVGYPGEDFIWAYLGRMFERAGILIDGAEGPAGN